MRGDESRPPPQLKSPDQYRRELMIEYAFAAYAYVITEDEADEIFFQPNWWDDVDAFVRYMQDVNFGTPIPGTTNVQAPGSMRVYTDAELDAMEEMGDFYPPTPDLASSSDGDSSSYADSEDEFVLEEEDEWDEEEEPEMTEDVEEEEEEEEIPLYEPMSKWAQRRWRNACSPPPDYDFEGELDDEQPEIEEEEDEPEDDQLDELSSWLDSLAVPAAPSTPAADDRPTEEEGADTPEVPDTPLQSPFSPVVVVEAAHAVEVTLQVAAPAVVVVKKKESRSSLLSTTSAPAPAPTPAVVVVMQKKESAASLLSAISAPDPAPVPVPAFPTRRERFDVRVRKAKSMLSRRLKAVCLSGLSS
ncbi:hypothetical protein PG999_001282 [Apiospora kogelbergensis]|uniref:Uncharacterized protein n=1 Tax=Apiospora kogelbergensis TaxID=1337665 RepID=A0AAW0RE65_9PEZI